jgi:hypothetical protein
MKRRMTAQRPAHRPGAAAANSCSVFPLLQDRSF